MSGGNKLISVVVSVYNEETAIKLFYERADRILGTCAWDHEIIFVNDGSRDASLPILEKIAASDKKVKVISFSRNFGHEAAMIAGIDYAKGDGIICMDADLQHPPEKIPEIIVQFDAGYDVVTLVRTKNRDAGIFKRITSSVFYRLMNKMSPVEFKENASDFIAVSKRAADVLRNDYREKARFLRGYVQLVGFNKTSIEYAAASRVAGKSKYNLKKLTQTSFYAMCSFSDMPLRLGIYAGVITAAAGFIIMIYTIVNKIINGAPAGYSTIIVVLCFMFAATLVIIGIIGEYLAVLLVETKARPIYIVEKIVNEDE